MFRDCDKSEPFHEMFCKVSSKGLNKGKLPPMIDKFVVSDFEFGNNINLTLFLLFNHYLIIIIYNLT